MAEKKVANSIVALSSAAVLAIYGAGYAKTREAADRFAQQAAERRPRLRAPQQERPAAATMESAVAVAAPIEPALAPAAPEPVVTTPVSTTTPAPQTSASASTTPLSGRSAPKATPDTPSAGEGEATLTASSAAVPSETPAAPPAAAQPAVVPAEPAKPGYKDGTYYGWGTSRHGEIQAEVVIEEGRIVLARVEKCQTRWSCNWVIPIPPVILKKQASTYDYVSGATDSSDAFQGAVAEALSQAK